MSPPAKKNPTGALKRKQLGDSLVECVQKRSQLTTTNDVDRKIGEKKATPLDLNIEAAKPSVTDENNNKNKNLGNELADQSAVHEVKSEVAAFWLPSIPFGLAKQSQKAGVIFVLLKASLSCGFVGKKYQILNPDEHASFMRKKNMNPYNYRPDIVHEACNVLQNMLVENLLPKIFGDKQSQALCQIMDNRLSMAGRLQAVYIETDEGILIRVEPHARIPRTAAAFHNMMVELLQKFSVKAKGNKGKLLRVVKNPITQHLPVNSRKIGLSFSSDKSVRLRDYVGGVGMDENLVFVIGAMAHGKIHADYVEDLISVSEYPLSAATCVMEICYELERKWRIH